MENTDLGGREEALKVPHFGEGEGEGAAADPQLPIGTKRLPIGRIQSVGPCCLTQSTSEVAYAAVHESDIHDQMVALGQIGVRQHHVDANPRQREKSGIVRLAGQFIRVGPVRPERVGVSRPVPGHVPLICREATRVANKLLRFYNS